MNRQRYPARLAFTFLATALVAAQALACSPGEDAVPAAGTPGRDAEILWDTWGIPHIRAEDPGSLFFAYGWAQARNHAELLLRNVGSARGRAAEYWGEEHLEDDLWYRRAGLVPWADEAYAGLDPEIRGYVDAFAAGLMAWVEDHPEAVSEEVRPVLPVDGVDVMANAGAIGLRFSSARGVRERWLETRSSASSPSPPGSAPSASHGARPSQPSPAGFPEPRALPEPPPAPFGRPGSNAWAIGPDRSASGDAMLLANPHLPWSGNLTWMEAHLTAPGVDVYGASLVGIPMINIGFNADLGWTHTVNTQDTEDVYELEVVDTGEGPGYPWDGEVRPFERRTEELRVRGPEGIETRELELLESVHGPVIGRDGDAALALRRVGDVGGGGLADSLRQWWEMARASDLGEFEDAIARQAVVGQNIVYADRHGAIAYFYGGATPRRPRGDTGFWRRVLPGDDPGLLWTEIHPFEEMPRVVNPAAGWVQNANDPPWHSTWPPRLAPSDYPPYMGPVVLPFRPQRSIRMLRESDTLSLEEMITLKHSTRMEMADRILPELLAAAGEHGSELARRAAGVLADWDRAADADSRGAVLFATWVQQAQRRAGRDGPFEVSWDPDRPLETPDGLADPARAVDALEAAARRVEEAHGDLAVAWGEVNRLRRGGLDLPGNGGSGGLGIFRVTSWADTTDGTRLAVGGDSFVAAVQFGESPRAFALIAYGNASQEGSPHRSDQLELFSTKQLRPVLFSVEEVDAQAVERTSF